MKVKISGSKKIGVSINSLIKISDKIQDCDSFFCVAKLFGEGVYNQHQVVSARCKTACFMIDNPQQVIVVEAYEALFGRRLGFVCIPLQPNDSILIDSTIEHNNDIQDNFQDSNINQSDHILVKDAWFVMVNNCKKEKRLSRGWPFLVRKSQIKPTSVIICLSLMSDKFNFLSPHINDLFSVLQKSLILSFGLKKTGLYRLQSLSLSKFTNLDSDKALYDINDNNEMIKFLEKNQSEYGAMKSLISSMEGSIKAVSLENEYLRMELDNVITSCNLRLSDDCSLRDDIQSELVREIEYLKKQLRSHCNNTVNLNFLNESLNHILLQRVSKSDDCHMTEKCIDKIENYIDHTIDNNNDVDIDDTKNVDINNFTDDYYDCNDNSFLFDEYVFDKNKIYPEDDNINDYYLDQYQEREAHFQLRRAENQLNI